MVLILQHQADAPAGLLLDAISARGLAPRTVRVELGEPLPDPEAVTVVVSLGSDRAADAREPAWIATELEWLRAADRAGTAILGLCFGAQALSTALGGAVTRASTPERGWIEVATTEPEAVPAGPWLTWHEDEIVPPDRACGREQRRRRAGVQVGRHLGVQFHPEVTPAIIADWVASYPHPTVDPEAMLEATAREFPRAALGARRLFDGFLASALGR